MHCYAGASLFAAGGQSLPSARSSRPCWTSLRLPHREWRTIAHPIAETAGSTGVNSYAACPTLADSRNCRSLTRCSPPQALASLARTLGSRGRVRLLFASRHTSLSVNCGAFTFHGSRRLRSMLARGNAHHRSDRKRSCILPLTGSHFLLAFMVRGAGRKQPAHSRCRNDASRVLARSLSVGRRRIKN